MQFETILVARVPRAGSLYAAKMRTTLLAWVAKNASSIREHCQPQTGEGLAEKAFGWSAAFTIAFLLDWENDNLSACFTPAVMP